VGYSDEAYVEYDLDGEDEAWLARFNAGGLNRLSDDKLERMLWRLEIACHEATVHALEAAGAYQPERLSAAAVAAIDHLPRKDALDMLRRTVGARDAILEAVFAHWADKRKRWQKPLIRRLRAPTSLNDNNPHNTFRPRERVNRPQTRRRRENTEECLDKLRLIYDNIQQAQQLIKFVLKRERKKQARADAAWREGLPPAAPPAAAPPACPCRRRRCCG